MNTRHMSIFSATAVALLSLSGAAQADGQCSNATLRGAYGFLGHGEILGLLDSNNVLHPFASASILDDVALVTFDGKGTFTRTDFGSINGVPKGGQTTFNPFQGGTYTVNADCTGTMSVIYTAGGPVPANVETDLNIVVTDDGTQVESVVYRAFVPFAQTAPGYDCMSNCVQGVQETFEGKKVSVHGLR